MTRVVVVTGVSAGVGRASALAFAARGCSVAFLARGLEGLEAAERETNDLGSRGFVVPVDVSDAEAVEAAADRIERELGPIDVWVNNAMVSVLAPLTDMSPSDFRRVTEVSCLGYVHGTMAALRRMRLRDAGVIVQVGSALAYRAIPLQSAYCGAKHAIEGFTESLRCELAHEPGSVRVTMVHPPAVKRRSSTGLRPPSTAIPSPCLRSSSRRSPPTRSCGRRSIRDASTGSRGRPPGAILANRVVPGLLDRYLARTGFDAQQTDQAVDPGRRDNLYKPFPCDKGARGKFGDGSKSTTAHWWLTRDHRRALAVGAALLGLLGLTARRPR